MKEELKAQLKVAMKAGDKIKVETIRSVLSAVQYDEVAQKVNDLPAAGVLEVIKRELKKRNEEIEFATQANRTDLLEKLRTEVSVLQAFLPKQLSAAEIEKIITELKAKNPAMNMGMIMKALKDSYAGQFDSKAASEIAKRVAG